MVEAGASVVALYQSDYLGDALDFGLNRIYVGDAGYQTPTELLTACRLAVPRVGVAGTSIQVLPMESRIVYPLVTVHLWASPEKLNQVQAQPDAAAAVVEYFARRDNAFTWSNSAIRSAIMGVVKNVHSIDVVVRVLFTPPVMGGVPSLIPVPEPVLATLFNVTPLPRYFTNDASVSVNIAGPT
jgi:hypothetical protein